MKKEKGKSNEVISEYGFSVYRDYAAEIGRNGRARYLEFDYAQKFISNLNELLPGMGERVQNAYLDFSLPSDWSDIKAQIAGLGGISNVMMESPFGQGRPWGAEFMDTLYRQSHCCLPLDALYRDSISGVAVDCRKPSVVTNSIGILQSMIEMNERQMTLINLGSAYGYDVFQLFDAYPEISKRFVAVNVDIDINAVAKGSQIAKKHGFKNVQFVQGDMMKMHRKINGASLVWLIGMLCSFGHKLNVAMIKSAAKYAELGGAIIGACVTDRMVFKDLFTCFTLEEIIGWHLCYRTDQDVKILFEDSGLTWERSFSEGNEEIYCIGIGRVQ